MQKNPAAGKNPRLPDFPVFFRISAVIQSQHGDD